MNFLTTGPQNSERILVLAHGAGAPMDHEWMENISALLAERDVKVVRFEFPYMQERRQTGKKRPPNSQKVLLQTWRDVIEEVKKDHQRFYIGGKSMGGRMASLLESDEAVAGLVCLGFPFHAPGREPGTRIDHLQDLATPTLIVQGERDSMGSKEDIQQYELSSAIEIKYLADGDHSFKPRVKSGFTLQQHLQSAADHIAAFMS